MPICLVDARVSKSAECCPDKLDLVKSVSVAALNIATPKPAYDVALTAWLPSLNMKVPETRLSDALYH